ncbi:TetR/AcrR family transcriptional regulator [Mycolicibacterium sp. BiH015]|uniref:TetR/AcrR family transcriptional regulator n=1 Tax=Mycolicibacterium sp. BiH015 TaxID=3018808 RepID=UPI0022E79B99|nr:TetR/AcrR family transcriptional regulator [Mycolicibacterium sp. BiH015]MDA2891593.1 TetR/AcrR family transcriptional regulator [Mycolicibacterium sp. BiH015]
MTAPRRPPTGAQPRAERTRTAVIDETVRCILDDGFAPPSVRRITDRAGVTWGVVQYHFGDLDGLLMAVVDTGFAELLATLQALESETARLERRERVAFVVNAVWQAFSSPTSRAAIEILISTRGARTEAVNAHLVDLMAQLTAFGRQLGEGLSAPHATRVGTLIWNTLRGIVAAQMMWHEPMDSSRDLQTLIDVVSAYIELRT